MKILIIDGQGGRLGRLLAEKIKSEPRLEGAQLYAVGTNSIATAAMLKSGADHGATGENPAIVISRNADYIIGPVGILCADALLGEVTEAMAAAIGRSPAKKILIPVNRCGILVAGVSDMGLSELAEEAVKLIAKGEVM